MSRYLLKLQKPEIPVRIDFSYFVVLWLGLSMMLPVYGENVQRMDWPTYGGDQGRNKFSPLTQINTENVHRLRIAWRYDTGDADKTGSQIQCNPLIVDGVLYATTSRLKVFALDAETGKRRWQFDPFQGTDNGQGINRGVSYWEKDHEKRILFTAGPYLYALDAGTGKRIRSFGTDGRVDLREGLGREASLLHVDATSPGAIYRDLIILGSRVTETPGSAPGHIRAYNVITGDLAWVFHTIPRPGEFGYNTWPPDAWKTAGGVNAWAGMSLDMARGLVFVPTGSPAYDFYGGERHGDNLFANSVLVLDAATGRRRWHFQTVHHDLWDRDLPAPPNLVNIEHKGRRVDALAQVTKSGFVFVLDRETGEPLFPVEERPVPVSTVAGESSSPTQPFPVVPPPFSRQHYNSKNVHSTVAGRKGKVLEKLSGAQGGGPFVPPSDSKATVVFPGFDGGAHWGGAAFDPDTGKLYVNATELPFTYRLIRIDHDSGDPGRQLYLEHCAACHGPDRNGNAGDVPSLVDIKDRLSSTQIEGIIRRGKGRMTGLPQLAYQEVLLLLDYLNTPEQQAARLANGKRGSKISKQGPRYLHTGQFPVFDKAGYPAIEPPWGTLTAIDLNKGNIDWQIPLGEHLELAQRGIRNTGTINYGGSVVTRGGLVFVAATMDQKIRAFNKNNGSLLWEVELPANGYATPSVYAVNGRQYVVIAAGGGKFGQKSSGEYLAFSL